MLIRAPLSEVQHQSRKNNIYVKNSYLKFDAKPARPKSKTSMHSKRERSNSKKRARKGGNLKRSITNFGNDIQRREEAEQQEQQRHANNFNAGGNYNRYLDPVMANMTSAQVTINTPGPHSPKSNDILNNI